MGRNPASDRKTRNHGTRRLCVVLSALLFLASACTPKVEPRKVSFMDLVKGEEFSEPVPFTAGTESQYSYDNTRIEMSGGVARLIGADQLDDDGTATGFGSADAIGVSPYGALTNLPSAQGLRLGLQGGCDGRSADCGGMNALSPSWTPQYASLAGYWTMDGALANFSNGNTLASRLGPSLTVTGAGSSRVNGKVGQAFSTGSTAYLFHNAPFSTQTTNISFGAWVYMTGSACSAIIFANGNTSSNGYALFIGDGSGGLGNKITLLISGLQYNALSASPSLAQNTWTHLMITRDASTWTLYVNGVAATTGTTNPNTPATSSSIGNNFPGHIDDVAFWNTTLTAAEVATIYRTQASGYSGVYHSRVMNSGSNTSAWTALKWAPALPYSKALPDAAGTVAQSESLSAYPGLASGTLMSGIAGLWHLNESAGTSGANSVADTSGKSRPLTPANGVVFGEKGRLDRAALYNGANSTLTLTTAAPVVTSTSTIAMWIKLQSRGTVGSQPTLAHSGDFYFAVDGSSGYLQFWDGTAWRTAGSGEVTLQQWHHVALVQSGTSSALYLNGAQVYSGPYVAGAAANLLELGSRADALSSPYTLNGLMDEVALWSRPLSSAEIQQLYTRGVSRLLFQVRSCMTFNCSDAAWKGPDGTAATYFGEEHNRATQAASPTGSVLAVGPQLALANYTSPVGTNRYFQYRVILGSDSANGALHPELKAVEAGPARYASNQPTIVYKTPIQYNKLSDFGEQLGAAGCAGGVRYSLSADGVFWVYYNGSAWDYADGSWARANTVAELKQSFKLLTTLSKSTAYVRAHLNSSGTQPCELDQLTFQGEK